MPRRLSELDKKIYKYALKFGKKGIPQNVLWKKLGITSRDASRSLKKLEELGFVERIPIVYNGRRTFRIIAIPKPIEEFVEKKEKIIEKPLLDIRKFLDIPCLSCPYIDKCYEGGYYDPVICDWLTEWLEKEIAKRRARKR
ncbi:helix-turn-helix transcriptional regulator [Staphylothermus hellenicus]|uniref:Putative transcriptional regulator, AsnC family n=1 Tax=Staphylothermus hellenicus (strain DSM 12710 / JCM 10830 / BK20S6-10-b1 / P8) TaxID=591019 RepID=D7D956_STAHD|nr:winged helix-turn-helix transcriptional regulator [Staphylothermus hellenicus]ADI32302.1 putative transcriptional regulator, AsnC family [Staphylothermus hellenicus DSM 12710]